MALPRITKGKCSRCGVIWQWAGAPLLREAICSECGKPLERTSHQKSLKMRWGIPLHVSKRHAFNN